MYDIKIEKDFYLFCNINNTVNSGSYLMVINSFHNHLGRLGVKK